LRLGKMHELVSAVCPTAGTRHTELFADLRNACLEMVMTEHYNYYDELGAVEHYYYDELGALKRLQDEDKKRQTSDVNDEWKHDTIKKLANTASFLNSMDTTKFHLAEAHAGYVALGCATKVAECLRILADVHFKEGVCPPVQTFTKEPSRFS
jgi:hypothetical protein